MWRQRQAFPRCLAPQVPDTEVGDGRLGSTGSGTCGARPLAKAAPQCEWRGSPRVSTTRRYSVAGSRQPPVDSCPTIWR